MNDEQMEFDFGPQPCTCDENTRYDDLCPACLTECLEWMATLNEEEEFGLQMDYYEEHA